MDGTYRNGEAYDPDLNQRVDELACAVLGHVPGPREEHTYHLPRLVGQTFRWRNCSRCRKRLEGETPSMTFDEIIREHYDVVEIARQMQNAASPFWRED